MNPPKDLPTGCFAGNIVTSFILASSACRAGVIENVKIPANTAEEIVNEFFI
jgi:hypothetical protein